MKKAFGFLSKPVTLLSWRCLGFPLEIAHWWIDLNKISPDTQPYSLYTFWSDGTSTNYTVSRTFTQNEDWAKGHSQSFHLANSLWRRTVYAWTYSLHHKAFWLRRSMNSYCETSGIYYADNLYDLHILISVVFNLSLYSDPQPPHISLLHYMVGFLSPFQLKLRHFPQPSSILC